MVNNKGGVEIRPLPLGNAPLQQPEESRRSLLILCTVLRSCAKERKKKSDPLVNHVALSLSTNAKMRRGHTSSEIVCCFACAPVSFAELSSSGAAKEPGAYITMPGEKKTRYTSDVFSRNIPGRAHEEGARL